MANSRNTNPFVSTILNVAIGCLAALSLAPSLAHGAIPDSRVLRVGLEPFPPLIADDGTGYSVDWLRALAREAGMTLRISIVPYSRAKAGLKNGKLDLIGHTPVGMETQDFYTYAAELNHRVATKLDAFSLGKQVLDSANFEGKSIGTPYGNAKFIAETIDLPQSQFVEAPLPNLVHMLLAGRITTIVFERASVVSHIPKETDTTIHYRLIAQIDAGFAVRRDRPQLLKQLNEASQRVDTANIYRAYSNLLGWPDRGTVPGCDTPTPGLLDSFTCEIKSIEP